MKNTLKITNIQQYLHNTKKTLSLLLMLIVVTGCQSTHSSRTSSQPIFPEYKEQISENSQTTPFSTTTDIKNEALAKQILEQKKREASELQALELKKVEEDNRKQAKLAKEKLELQKKQRKLIHKEILVSQRQRNSKKNKVNIRNGNNLPAFNRMMKLGVDKLRKRQLSEANRYFISAQRIAPQSPAVYMYLGEIALKKSQATKAENLARRGLVVSRSKRYDKALWNVIYLSAKTRNKPHIMQEAKKALYLLQK